MKPFRKRSVVRVISCFFLLNFVQSIFLPGYSYALTTGPHQPEYLSYEGPGATDMVNLMTGDFSLSLPVLEVPGPEGGFSLPLSYHAGIQLQQESSWVGLGFSLNAGCIQRTVNGFPDDANGEAQSVTVQDMTGVTGWHQSYMGMINYGWNSQSGRYGSVSLLGLVSASWSREGTTVGIAGISVGSDGVTFDAVQFVSAAITVASWGGAGAAAAAKAVGEGATSAVASQAASQAVLKQVATDALTAAATGSVASLFGGSTPTAPSDGYWKYSTREKKFITGFANLRLYKIWLDQTRVENMYGTLYLGNAPLAPYGHSDLVLRNGGAVETLQMYQRSGGTSNQGAASDISFQRDGHRPFHEANNPAVLATDNFSVKAPGISGAITPYRLDIGSVSMPREMTSYHLRFAPVPFLNSNSYKVPFIYDGQLSNSYFHHVGGASAVSSPTYHFGINANASTDDYFEGKLTYDLNDVIFKNERIKSTLPPSKKIPQANYIEWLSNAEIRGSMTYPSKFLDFLSGGPGPAVSSSSDRHRFRTNFSGGLYGTGTTSGFSSVIPVNGGFASAVNVGDKVDLYLSLYNTGDDQLAGMTSEYVEIKDVTVDGKTSSSIQSNDFRLEAFAGRIADIEMKLSVASQTPQGTGNLSALGGFCITNESGVTYHFALPVYDYENYNETRNVSDHGKRSIIKRTRPFANTWLLTAVTGVDYIDRNGNGLADEGDWGYWAKLNYGIHTNSFKWRLPYTEQEYTRSANNSEESYSQGKKQLIYLNSIETRSHVALFKKSLRLDGKSAGTGDYVFPMKLDEIILLSKDHYKRLIAPVAQGGFVMQDYSNQINYLFDNNSLSAGAQDFIVKNAASRIQFTYTYDLCQGTLNSDHAGKGKLTLKKLSFVGRNNQKTMPDYVFEYGYNPSYNKHHWDGFGMYNPSGNVSGNTHTASQDVTQAEAWSLSKVITPLGSEILVDYETDDYSFVSGSDVYGKSFGFSDFGVIEDTRVINVDHDGEFSPGDRVYITGNAIYGCVNNPGSGLKSVEVDGEFTVATVTANSVTTAEYFVPVECTGAAHFEIFDCSIQKVTSARKGGGVRVASLTMRNEFGEENKIRYLYKRSDGRSSGVISQEPEYIEQPQGPVYDLMGYPQTPVIYGTVAVLSGKLSNDNDYHTKQVYEFETPKQDQYTLSKNVIMHMGVTEYDAERFYVSIYENKIEDRASKIGSLKSVKLYDKAGNLYSSSTMEYTDQVINNGTNNYQGVYSNGLLMFDMVSESINRYHKINRTTSLSFPYTIKKVTNSKDGFTTESTNLSWDFITGTVDQKLDRSSLGLYVKSVTKLAYTVPEYAEMGTRADNINNRNMLSQVAATYTYKSDASGSNIGLMSAEAQMWAKQWPAYKIYDAENPEGTTVSSTPAWRKSATYTWKGNYGLLRADGTHTFNSSDEFNFGSVPSNTLWQYIGETERYDQHGMPLQSKNLNNIYASGKMGYDNRMKIAEASNAQYHEIAFSSAEDRIPGTAFFGGEVGLGSGSVLYRSKGGTSITHTGDAVVSLSSGYSFVYKTSGLTAGKTYRASVWTNSTDGRIYYKLDGGSEQLSAAPTTATKAGDWYRIDVRIPMGSATSIEVGVKSAGGTVLFDDFRFQPMESAMTCYVFNPLSYEFTTDFNTYTWVLDNDNLYTRFEESADGRLSKTFRETIRYGGEKLISEEKRDYRRFYVNETGN